MAQLECMCTDGYKQGFSACVWGLNIFCGILGTVMPFLKYAEVYEAHRIAAVSWSSLGRNIQIELARAADRRKNCRDFLKVSRAEYDRLLESAPRKSLQARCPRKIPSKHTNRLEELADL
eukprot:COSAG02_NODE_30949_length_542_cov_0.713318_2_plen_119_part_01